MTADLREDIARKLYECTDPIAGVDPAWNDLSSDARGVYASDADALLAMFEWHLAEARVDALLDAAHALTLVGPKFVERDAVIRVLRQWGSDPRRLATRPAEATS